jgi:uncharacterized repeat protein (TIGR01451 family)
MAFGATKSLTLAVNSDPDTRGSRINQATVASSNQDTESENNQAAATTDLRGEADLEVTKVVSKNNMDIFSTVVFTVTVTNKGPSQATGVVISDTIPAGYSDIVTDPKQGSYASGVWNVGILNVNASAKLVLSAKVLPSGPYNNTAEVAQANEIDLVSRNNSVTLSVTPVLADLSLTQTVSTGRPGVGDEIVITLKVLNSGPNSAGGIQVEDILPTGLTFVSSTAAGYDETTGIWTVGSLSYGQEAVLSITVRVTQVGTITNIAQVKTSDKYDPDSTPGNNGVTEDDYASEDLPAAYYLYLPFVHRQIP